MWDKCAQYLRKMGGMILIASMVVWFLSYYPVSYTHLDVYKRQAWSGTSYQEANASKTGGLVYLLALVFVFLALAALYESWGLPLAILMSVPVAVLGAVLFIGGSHLLDALSLIHI